MTVQLKSMSIQTARLVIATTALLCCTSPDIAAEPGIPDALLTVAERSDFTETSRSDEVKGLVDRFAAMAAHVRVYEIGRTNEDRPILAAEVDSHWAAGNKGNNGADDRLTILLLGNIHSGECAGKEALLMLLRDLTLDHKHRWLDDFRIIFVPNYSADANERMGALHRPGQIGPNTRGLRENAQGLDLNRDF
ncbi:MAG: hypothetical protein GY826_17840, partial [Fuerstiella sp.]|nr:hypothetical protein [Fuerstiella sp.]